MVVSLLSITWAPCAGLLERELLGQLLPAESAAPRGPAPHAGAPGGNAALHATGRQRSTAPGCDAAAGRYPASQ